MQDPTTGVPTRVQSRYVPTPPMGSPDTISARHGTEPLRDYYPSASTAESYNPWIANNSNRNNNNNNNGGPTGGNDNNTVNGYKVSGRRQSAYEMASTVLESYGLGSLVPVYMGYAQQGLTAQEAMFKIRETSEYKQRFAGNEARLKNGLTPLSEAEYLRTEAAYQNTLQSYGLPKGFYDSPEDYSGFIANNISPVEVADRAQRARAMADYAESNNPEYVKAMRRFYGVDKGGMTAYFLDEEKATNVLMRQYDVAMIGGEALKADIDSGKKYAEKLKDQGITQDQAREAFGTVQQTAGSWNDLAAVSGEDALSDKALANAELGVNNGAQVRNKQKRLASRERARFGGNGGGTGMFTDPVSGLM